MVAFIGKKRTRELTAQSEKFFSNCGRAKVNGTPCSTSRDFMAHIMAKDNFVVSEADRLLEEMRHLNLTLEVLHQGNQYVPEEMIGKCPRLIIDTRPSKERPDGLPIHIGTQWY